MSDLPPGFQAHLAPQPSLPDTPQRFTRALASLVSGGSRAAADEMALEVATVLSDPSVFSDRGPARSGSAATGVPCASWLHAFARQGDYASARLAARKSSDIDRPDEDDGASPLLLAISSRNLDAAMAFIDAGANVQARDRDGLGVLHCAAFSGDLAMLNLALALAPDQLNEFSIGSDDMLDRLGQAPESYDEDQDEPRYGSGATYKTADHARKEPLRSDLFANEGLAPIHCAALTGFAESVEFLVSAGADIRALSRPGDSCLGAAIGAGSAEAVAALIKGGALVDGLDGFGRSPLSIAIKAKNARCARELLAAGASMEARGPIHPDAKALANSAQMEMEACSSPEIKALMEARELGQIAFEPRAPKPSKGVGRGL